MMRFTAMASAVILSAACYHEPVEARQQDPLPDVDVIGGDRVVTVLAPDAIPAVDQPRFVPASEATFMRDDEPIVGVVIEGVAKAYSTWFLDHHEIVNDTFGDQPVAVTW